MRLSIIERAVVVDGYSFIRKEPVSWWGWYIYIKSEPFPVVKIIKFCPFIDVRSVSFEVFPLLLSRFFISSSLDNKRKDGHMREPLFQSLAWAELTYPNCTIIITGDSNSLKISSIKKRLKLIGKKPITKIQLLTSY